MNIKKQIQESINVKNSLLKSKEAIDKFVLMINALNSCYSAGGKILIAGNGGSAADAQHFAAEIVGRYKKERKGYPAIALTTDSSILTAWSNDYSFDSLFSRQIEALGNIGDVFFGISTSGNSKNIIEGVKKARKLGIKTICLLGKDGGTVKGLADISLVIPSDDTARIQETHIMCIHIMCEEIEKNFK